MDNKVIAKLFKLGSQLMELHNENPFRAKAMASASFKIDKLPFPAATATVEDLSAQQGIGKGTAEKIQEIIQTGSFAELDQLIANTPPGLLDMLQIKGLGPKKILIIWKELGIESVGELYYACNENRLVEAKGFGLKTQEDIKKNIEFSIANQGWFLYAKVLPCAEAILNKLRIALPEDTAVAYTGAFRRKVEILDCVDFLLSAPTEELQKVLATIPDIQIQEQAPDQIEAKDSNGFLFRFLTTDTENFAHTLLETTGSELHIQQLEAIQQPLPSASTEAGIYQLLGLAYIEPELREGLDEIQKAKTDTLPQLITFEELKGTVHNHSTYSDGVHSLAEMARYCKEDLGLAYFGICDHSRTAVYANGLSIDRLEQQWKEVDALNEKMAPFRIFKGIESDILSDGSLDYPNEILAKFDFVVASVHSNLKMDEDKATDRLIKAIENPYTTILGHPTGRLLLSRSGYPLDFKKIIDACAANQVVIEINANPLRLDLDWRWHRYAIEKGVLLSINPDAHRTEGLLDMHYGVYVARKGGVSAANCLNARSVTEISEFFTNRKTAKGI
ncbi:helix-hairpin-helix domain-containing protein [Sphingobacterium spiritivorum]|uniref:helix-hairpin-helix domain-containing protein n=1 Tax=Sphingobacterium spiritivorum TaxID=258 RepID=UPI003DA539D2